MVVDHKYTHRVLRLLLNLGHKQCHSYSCRLLIQEDEGQFSVDNHYLEKNTNHVKYNLVNKGYSIIYEGRSDFVYPAPVALFSTITYPDGI